MNRDSESQEAGLLYLPGHGKRLLNRRGKESCIIIILGEDYYWSKALIEKIKTIKSGGYTGD